MQLKLNVKTIQLAPRLITALLALAISIASILILSWQYPKSIGSNLAVGDVAPNNITAPTELDYTSQILTEEAAEDEAKKIPPVYESQQSRVLNQQIEKANDVLYFISLVLADGYADPELRAEYLYSITDPEIPHETIDQVLTTTPEEWKQIVGIVPEKVREIMQTEIKDDDPKAITNAKNEVDTLFEGVEDNSVNGISAALVRNFISPNSFYNAEETAALQQQARNTVKEQSRQLKKGESIIRSGDIVSPQDIEALEQFGLARDEWSWWTVFRAALLTTALLILVGLALYNFLPQTKMFNHKIAFLALIALIWLFAAKLMVTPTGNNAWVPYLYPLAALSMLISVFIDLRVSIIFTTAFGLLILYISNSNFSSEFATYCIAGSLIGAFTLTRTERITSFLWSSLAISISNLLVYLIFNSPLASPLETKQLYILIAVCLNGIFAASLTLIGYFFMGNIFGFTTSLQLTELSRPTHPLLRQLLLKAPGTYHHTIVVSNLAERAADAIGADALLTRVGAYYHDIGKTVRPYFFIENSAHGAESPHDKLDPQTSAQIIISHVTDGLDLAHKYKLPTRIQHFIREHHGTSMVHYFYQQAQNLADAGEAVDESEFRYAGPKPRSKETAILSLADMCESAIRSIRPKTRAELAEIVDRLIDERVDAGELNESDLTFKELYTVKDIFVQVLQGVHHPRITYPAKEEAETDMETASLAEEGNIDTEMDSVTMPAKPQIEPSTIERIPIAEPADAVTDTLQKNGEIEEEVVPGGVEQAA